MVVLVISQGVCVRVYVCVCTCMRGACVDMSVCVRAYHGTMRCVHFVPGDVVIFLPAPQNDLLRKLQCHYNCWFQWENSRVPMNGQLWHVRAPRCGRQSHQTLSPARGGVIPWGLSAPLLAPKAG